MPTALVTGTRSELGAAYARELAERGYSIVLVADDATVLADAAERLGRATGAIVETLVADPARPDAALRRIADPAIPVELFVAADPDPSWRARLTDSAVAAMIRRGRGGILHVPAGDDEPGARPSPGVTITAVRAGRAAAVEALVRRSLDDAARGRTVSAPGVVHRALGAHLDVSRWVARRAADAARSAWAAPSARPSVPGRGARPEVTGVPAGETRPSPVPTPFRSAPAAPAPARSASGAAPALPAVPVRPAHVAGPFPEPRVSASGSLPPVAPCPASRRLRPIAG